MPFLFLLASGLAAALAAATLTVPAAAQQRGSVIVVAAGGDLQAALDRARPGDVIQLTPGATFTGNFVLPRTDGERFIRLRTAPARGQPAPSTRVSPAHLHRLATIRSPNASAALRTAPGAHHWRLELLAFGPNARGGDILLLGDGSRAQFRLDQVPYELVVDRCYIFGDPLRGQKRGIALNSASTTIVNSHIGDIKLTGQDAQAIAGWNGPGPFHIENNYLEASGENFMLGGASPEIPGLVPSDVVFRRNHLARPLSWQDERWSVKNLFELKNARRVLVEGNLFEHNWQDAQPGYAIVLTPSGQRGEAPWSTVEDVTFQYNVVRKVAAVFNLLGRDDTGPSERMSRIRIAHNLIYAVDRSAWGGNGTFLQIGEGPADVVVEHNTIVHTGNVVTAYGGPRDNRTEIPGFVFRHNLTRHNGNGVFGSGQSPGLDTLQTYFPGAVFVGNVLAGGRSSRYPAGNDFPDLDRFAGEFVDYARHDYRLRRDSIFRGAAPGGADLGVNFMELARALGPRAREWLQLRGAAPQP